MSEPVSNKLERRIFVGLLGREDEFRCDDAYVVVSEDPIRIAFWQKWVYGLTGKYVRIAVEAFASERELREHEVRVAVETGNCPRCNREIVHEGTHERDSSNDVHRCPEKSCGWFYCEMESWHISDI